MRSRTRSRLFGGALVLILLTASVPAQEPGATTPISQEDIDVAVAMVKRDPNLGGERTMKMLQWRESRQPVEGGFEVAVVVRRFLRLDHAVGAIPDVGGRGFSRELARRVPVARVS